MPKPKKTPNEAATLALAKAIDKLADAINALPRNFLGLQVNHSQMGWAPSTGTPPLVGPYTS